MSSYLDQIAELASKASTGDLMAITVRLLQSQIDRLNERVKALEEELASLRSPETEK